MAAGFKVVIAAGAVVAAALGAWTWTRLAVAPEPPPSIGGFMFPEPLPLPPVELVDEDGERFTPARFAGHWSILYFGYTYCPDVCPLALVALAAAAERLESTLPGTPIEYYLVSVDPKRDTPERLRDYVRYFNPGFHGLTGPLDAVADLAKASQAVFFVPEGQGADNYLVSHSNNFALLDPAGRLHALFTPPHDPAGLATDFVKIVEHHAAAR